MATPFQVATLVASPLYPNAIAWSEENLIAVATNHIVTILNPDNPHSPRGVVTLSGGKPFPVGVIDRKDLVNDRLLPTCLSRDQRPCVRSIAWSPVGFAPNGGCLLALCATDGQVKIYRQPYCEYQAEWIEVIDVSEMLYQYFSKTNYGEHEVESSPIPLDSALEIQTGTAATGDTNSSRHGRKRQREKGKSTLEDIHDANTAIILSDEIVSPSSEIHEGSDVEVSKMDGYCVQAAAKLECNANEKKLLQSFPMLKSKRKSSSGISQDSSVQFITADQYANRSALLASLAVAWSPALQFPAALASLCTCCCLLAVGAKSGRVSIWKVQRPLSYFVEHGNVSPIVMLLGLIEVQSTWITTLTWGIVDPDASNPQLLLATGGSDGTVKIWLCFATNVLRSTEAEPAPFCLMNEVIPVVPSPVVVLSLMVTVLYGHKILLAVGKGSGSFEVHTMNIGAYTLRKVGSCHGHNCAMTGFAWAFDGRLLYSCSQENCVRGWIVCEDSLSEVTIPPNSLGIRIKAPTDVPSVYDTCNGVAVSPGNLAIAVVRGFDPHTLNPMYQARTMKAAIEFFWIGGQQLDISTNTQLKLDDLILSGFPKEELVSWGSNLLWSLNRFEHPDYNLVVWDIMAASLAIQQCAPKFIEHILFKWASFLFDAPSDLSSECLSSDSSRSFLNIASRQLQLLNILCRHLMLPIAEQVNCKILYATENDQLWMELLLHSEMELRERLVGFNLATFLCLKDHNNLREDQVCNQTGITLMLKWTNLECDEVRNRLDLLTSKVKWLATRQLSVLKRHQTNRSCEVDEQCSYCLAPVPFESPEVAVCQGINCNNEDAQKHKLARCSISMQVCPPGPAWFCICCQRRTSRLAPQQLYKMPSRPQDFVSFINSLKDDLHQKPLCPFCGILLQRLQPGFLLSASPIAWKRTTG